MTTPKTEYFVGVVAISNLISPASRQWSDDSFSSLKWKVFKIEKEYFSREKTLFDTRHTTANATQFCLPYKSKTEKAILVLLLFFGVRLYLIRFFWNWTVCFLFFYAESDI